MARALELARRGHGQTSPNPLVGAVICSDGGSVGEGYHARLGDAHAEVAALRAAGERARGATLYVTLEPCNHRGRTPACTDAIISAGISRVVTATHDPNPDAAGGAERLRAAGITVDLGVLETEARELNAAFFHSFSSERPFVTLKLAISLDGAIAGAKGAKQWITSESSRAEVHRLRAGSDAIAVGVQTALADDPELTVRAALRPRRPPVRIVFDHTARLPAESVLARTARDIPTLVVTAINVALPAELAEKGVEAMPAHDLGDALRQLRKRGVLSLMVEGGAGLAASFLGSRCVDRLIIFQAPVILGERSLKAFSGVAAHDLASAPRFSVVSTARLEDDIMTVYSVAKQ